MNKTPLGFSPSTLTPEDLPPNWSSRKLGDICTVDWGNTSITKASYIPAGFPAFSATGQDGFLSSYEHDGKAIIVSAIGARCGKCFLATGKWTAIKNTIVVKPVSELIDIDYVYYSVNDEEYWVRSGSGQPFIAIGRAKEQPIITPPFSEQQAIAEVLRTVQRAKEATEKVIAACRQLKQTLMRYLFTYGPVPFDRADKVVLKEMDYGTVPESWANVSLSDCSHVQTGVAKGRHLNTTDTITVPYLRVANVQDGFLDLREIKEIAIRPNELPRFSLNSGDVLLTEGGDFDKLGRGFVWQGQLPVCVHQNHIFAVRVRQDKVLPDFLAYLTQSSYGKSYFLTVAHRTTHLACINATKLKALPVLLPSIKEQQAMAGALHAVDRKIQQEQQRLATLTTLFNTLLHHLMTGKMRVSVPETASKAEAKR